MLEKKGVFMISTNTQNNPTQTIHSIPSRADSDGICNCAMSKTAINVITILGFLLMAAGVGCFIAGAQAPAIALLVMGVAAVVLGFSLRIKEEANLATDTQPFPKDSLPKIGSTTEIQAVKKIETTLEESLAGATFGQAVGDAIGVSTE